MKRYLIRSGMSPLNNFNPAHIASTNSIGGNVGNLVYGYSIYRTLLTEDCTITPDYYWISPSKADYINENYDGYIIPLADAFRPDFIPDLEKYTKLINKLTIPVYVIGVGARTPFDAVKGERYEFDEAAKNFIKAVLNKSAMIGVRGQITSDYLSGLGFKEGTDHTIIGCPSMYAFGRDLKIRDTTITKDSFVTINNSLLSPENVLRFIDRSRHEFKNYTFIPQWLKELKMYYLGGPDLEPEEEFLTYPDSVLSDYYTNHKVTFPFNMPTWFDVLKRADLSFGARLHGNIAATIVGTPSIILPKDGRMRELADYHQLTSYWGPDITEETNIWDIIERSDFHQPEKVAHENFDHYIDFLNINGIDHIYKETSTPSQIYFDDMLKQTVIPPLEPSYFEVPIQQQISRWEAFNAEENARIRRHTRNRMQTKFNKERRLEQKERTKLEKTIAEKEQRVAKYEAKIMKYEKNVRILKTKVQKQERTLNRKAVKMSLKMADSVAKILRK